MLNGDKISVIEGEMTNGIRQGVQILKREQVDLNDRSSIIERLRSIWEQTVLRILNGLGEDEAAKIWSNKSSPDKEEFAREKEYSLDNFVDEVMTRVQ